MPVLSPPSVVTFSKVRASGTLTSSNYMLPPSTLLMETNTILSSRSCTSHTRSQKYFKLPLQTNTQENKMRRKLKALLTQQPSRQQRMPLMASLMLLLMPPPLRLLLSGDRGDSNLVGREICKQQLPKMNTIQVNTLLFRLVFFTRWTSSMRFQTKTGSCSMSSSTTFS